LGIIQDMCPDDTEKGREALSKTKQLLSKIAACGKEAFIEAMARALGAVEVQGMRGFFVHSGYRAPAQQI